MNKPKIFRALACALLAAAFTAAGTLATPPVAAYASEPIVISDENADGSGVINITASGDYVVNGDLSHAIKITAACTLTFNNDAKLVLNDSEHDAIQVYTGESVTINNARVVQSAAMKALRVDSGSSTTLNNCSISALGQYQCIDVESGTLTINSGEYKALAGSNVNALIRCYKAKGSTLNINGGSFYVPAGATLVSSESNAPSINGGSFDTLDVLSYINFYKTNKVFSKNAATGLWDFVDNDDDASDGANYLVRLGTNVVAYVADEADAKTFAEKVDGTYAPITFAVGFDLNGGYSASGDPDEYDDQDVSKGGYAKKPADPYKEGYKFVKWVVGEDDDAEAFDFENNQILKNYELRAIYVETSEMPVLTYDANGGTFTDGTTKTQTYKYAAMTSELDVEPTRDGKYFAGWTLDGVDFEFGKPITKSATLKAKWADPVAECDGKGYQTLQDAFKAAKDGSTVKLLSDVTLGSEYVFGAYCSEVNNLTFDLNKHTITFEAADSSEPALGFLQCDDLKVKNGYVELEDASGIYLADCERYELSELTVEVKSGVGSAILALGSTGKILSGWYSASGDEGRALDVGSGSVEIKGGAFLGMEDEESGEYSTSVYVHRVPNYSDATLTVTNGDFYGEIEDEVDGLSISGGTFDYIWNVDSIEDGYALLKRKADNGRYVVVKADDDGIPSEAYWSASFTVSEDEERYDFVIYFDDGQEVQDFKEIFEEKTESEYPVTVTRLRYKVTFRSGGDDVETRGVRVGKAVGELPAGKEVAGWSFYGWCLDGQKVDAGFVPTDDVTLVAHWVKNGSGEESDDPEEDGDDSGKGDEADKDGKSDKAMPQTGDSTNAVLPVCVAIAGVLVCALGLLFKARKRK